MPFRSKEWSYISKDNPTGNMFHTDDPIRIMEIMAKTSRKIIVIDDFQYVMVNELFAKIDEKGYDKFTSIAKNARNILTMANNLADDKRVYILSHTETETVSEGGRIKIKTIGKMLDNTLTPEGLILIVMRTAVTNGQYLFRTQNNGKDTVKTPMDMFNELYIDNDLAAVDAVICDFYNLNQQERDIENEFNS